ncbi:MAG: hypothetical protein WD058_05540, partial [Dehalococcoidia bacterium]
MTPLRGLFRRLKGETTSVLDAPATTDRTERDTRGQRNPRTQRDIAPASGGGPVLTDDEPGQKRRRGRRGGRNRRRPGDDTQNTTQDTTQPAGQRDRAPEGDRRNGNGGSRDAGTASEPRGQRSQGGRSEGGRSEGGRSPEGRGSRSSNGSAQRSQGGQRDRYQWGRKVEPGEADERSRRANSRRRDVRGRSLDAPLPEDIAFRPGQDGGDSSILPNRRRRPGGLHDTARVLVGGARTVGAWVKRDERHGEEPPLPHVPSTNQPAEIPADDLAVADAAAAPTAPSTTPDVQDEVDEAGTAKRRRRGRRGGRGRRRPTPDADGMTATDAAPLDAAPAAEEPDDIDEEIEAELDLDLGDEI